MSPARFEHLLGDEVRRVVDQLPDVFKVPMMLCDADDMSYDEIAKVMGCPVGTVRSRISRARAFLQRELAGYARRHGYLKSRRKA